MNKHKTFALLTVLAALVCVGVRAETGGRHHGLAAGAAPAKAFGDVTNIREIRNHTRHEVLVWKMDAPGVEEQQETIPARGVFNGDFWVPWADNEDEFGYKHMTISVNGMTIAWIWQNGAYVRFNSARRFVTNARVVPGLARSGGNRRVVISEASGGRFLMRFEEFR